MAWSKVKGWPPFGWWFHKLLCEFWWHVGYPGGSRYYHHLKKLCDYGFNIYGDKL
jgi:hypothetical protein